MSTASRSFEILLAEDNSADIALVRQALARHQVPCVLHVTRDGEEAIRWIASLDSKPTAAPLDLLLLDMHLPKRDGEDILKHLRSTEHYGQTPVIVMTSLDSSVAEEKATKNAALAYFRKPSTLDEFLELGSIVQSVLAGKTTPDAGAAGEQNRAGGAA